ncbi:MAG TPA: pilus assembly protein [Bordetella sp.]
MFFCLVYAILTYGVIMAAQQSINFAAEEGARRVLQWASDRPTRANAALTLAASTSAWVSGLGGMAATQIAVCDQSGTLTSNNANAATLCNGLVSTSDASRVAVVVRYPYQANPLVPLLPGISYLVPTMLGAQASVQLADAGGQGG